MNAHVSEIELKRSVDYSGLKNDRAAERKLHAVAELLASREPLHDLLQESQHKPAALSGRESAQDRKALEEYLGDVKDRLAKNNVELKFTFHEDTGALQVELINAENDKIVRKIPPDELIKLSSSLREMAGAFLDRSV